MLHTWLHSPTSSHAGAACCARLGQLLLQLGGQQARQHKRDQHACRAGSGATRPLQVGLRTPGYATKSAAVAAVLLSRPDGVTLCRHAPRPELVAAGKAWALVSFMPLAASPAVEPSTMSGPQMEVM